MNMKCAGLEHTRTIYGECKRTIYPERSRRTLSERHAENKKFVKKTHERHETHETHVVNFYIPLSSFALRKRRGENEKKFKTHERHETHETHIVNSYMPLSSFTLRKQREENEKNVSFVFRLQVEPSFQH
jgi:hypothetical protein